MTHDGYLIISYVSPESQHMGSVGERKNFFSPAHRERKVETRKKNCNTLISPPPNSIHHHSMLEFSHKTFSSPSASILESWLRGKSAFHFIIKKNSKWKDYRIPDIVHFTVAPSLTESWEIWKWWKKTSGRLREFFFIIDAFVCKYGIMRAKRS